MSDAGDPTLEAAAAAAAVDAAVGGADSEICQPVQRKSKSPRRTCRFPGCTKSIKSQGHCQKHGAKAKRCRIDGCDKQAQGTHDGMCKRHWNDINKPAPPPKPEDIPPEPQGPSVYDVIVPASVAWKLPKKRAANGESVEDGDLSAVAVGPDPTEVSDPMPLIAHLKNNSHLEAGWHRSQERLARGIHPAKSNSTQFETWERQLVMFEIMLLAGISNASHKDLAHAWGREKGFHNVLVAQVCDRRGVIERKKRADHGRKMTDDQKASFKEKLNRSRAASRAAKKAKTAVASEVAAEVVDGELNALPPASVGEMMHEQSVLTDGVGEAAEV